MKRISQYLMLTGLSGLLCLFLAVPANAQRGGEHGGGGGGSHSGGGGGGGSHGGSGGGGGFHGGGNAAGSFSRPSGGFRQQSNISPRLGAQGRTQGITGNTRGFSNGGNRVGVTGGYRGYNNRVGVAGGYRGSVAGRTGFYRGGRYYGGGYYNRGGFGLRYSPWYRHGGYFYHGGFYGSLYYPRLGFSLGILPFGYYPFYWGDAQFFYSDGYFYQQNNNQYTVVEPPIGAAINSLPDKAQAITINGQQYYELNGVYYQPITKDDGSVVYQVAGKDGQLNTDQGNGDNGQAVAAPEIGDLFYELPPDTRKIKLNGEQFYVSPDDFYYQEVRDQNGKKSYKVVGTPDDAPGN